MTEKAIVLPFNEEKKILISEEQRELIKKSFTKDTDYYREKKNTLLSKVNPEGITVWCLFFGALPKKQGSNQIGRTCAMLLLESEKTVIITDDGVISLKVFLSQKKQEKLVKDPNEIKKLELSTTNSKNLNESENVLPSEGEEGYYSMVNGVKVFCPKSHDIQLGKIIYVGVEHEENIGDHMKSRLVKVTGLVANASVPDAKNPEFGVFLNAPFVEMLPIHESLEFDFIWRRIIVTRFNPLNYYGNENVNDKKMVFFKTEKDPFRLLEQGEGSYFEQIPLSNDPKDWIMEDKNKIESAKASLMFSCRQGSLKEIQEKRSFILRLKMWQSCLNLFRISKKTGTTSFPEWKALGPIIFDNLKFFAIGSINVEESAKNLGGINGREDETFDFGLSMNVDCFSCNVPALLIEKGISVSREFAMSIKGKKIEPLDENSQLRVINSQVCVNLENVDSNTLDSIFSNPLYQYKYLVNQHVNPRMIEGDEKISKEKRGEEFMRMFNDPSAKKMLPPQDNVYMANFSGEKAKVLYAIIEFSSLSKEQQLKQLQILYDIFRKEKTDSHFDELPMKEVTIAIDAPPPSSNNNSQSKTLDQNETESSSQIPSSSVTEDDSEIQDSQYQDVDERKKTSSKHHEEGKKHKKHSYNDESDSRSSKKKKKE